MNMIMILIWFFSQAMFGRLYDVWSNFMQLYPTWNSYPTSYYLPNPVKQLTSCFTRQPSGFLVAELPYKYSLPVRPSVCMSVCTNLCPYVYPNTLVTTTPPKRLDGLSWNLQRIFLKVFSCAFDKSFQRQSISKPVSRQNQKPCDYNSS